MGQITKTCDFHIQFSQTEKSKPNTENKKYTRESGKKKENSMGFGIKTDIIYILA